GVDREDVGVGKRDRSRFEVLRARRKEPDRRALPRGAVHDRVAVGREPCGADRPAAKREGAEAQWLIAGRARAPEKGGGESEKQNEQSSRSPPESAPYVANRRFRRAGDRGRRARKRIEVEREVMGRVEALLGVLLETVGDEALEPRRHVLVRDRKIRWILLQDRRDRLGRRLAVERPLPREHLVQDRPEREDVAARIRRF